MKRLLLLGLGALSLTLLVAPAVYSAPDPPHVTGHTVVIDAGHGGSDPGSTECEALEEADANLDIAQRLRDLLVVVDDGNTVYMTRESDETLSNNDRYSFANSTDGEALVSIHLNGSLNHETNGTLGLYGKRNKDKEFTEVLHARLAADLSPVPDLGVTNFASGVLLKSNMLATIQESVFISNTDECGLLTNGTGVRQQEIAQSLYNGLSDWFSVDHSDDGPGGGKPPGKGKTTSG